MKTDADRLAEFILDRTPTISKCGNRIALDFDDVDQAKEFLDLLEDLMDAIDARKAKADLEARLGMPWQQATIEQLREAGCVNVRDVIAALPEDEQSEIERQVAELKTHLDDPVDCSDIPEITELGPRLKRDAEGRLVVEFDATQALAARRVRAEETRQALQDEINRERRSTST